MGNKKKVGTRRLSYKRKKVVAKSTDEAATSTPIQKEKHDHYQPSSSKIKLSQNLDKYNDRNDIQCYEIIDLDVLELMLHDIAVCKFCNHPLHISRKSIVGLASQIKILCKNCESVKTFENCKKVDRPIQVNNDDNKSHTFYDLNLRLILGMRTIGKGYKSAQSLCGIMNLSAPPTMFSLHEKALTSTVKSVCEESMKSAVEEACAENSDDRNLCVALDGSWQKRGFSSLNGIVSLTSVDTGKVLDICALSKYCKCPQRLENIHEDDCQANYRGTSGGMEIDGAIKLFSRSMPKYNVKYTEYLGDGDSKGYQAVCEAQPYGQDVSIHKLECIGHIQKRMGTRLFKLRNEKLSDGKPLKGKGRLTGERVKKLQIFYGLAIRRNTHSVKDMQRAIWATYFHVQSTNENPTHQLCPKDANTWCKFHKAAMENAVYDHKNHFHIPEIIMSAIKPVFKSLADPLLLEKCLKGKTQNPNESLNNLIWTRVPKRTFVTLPVLELGVYEAVSSFNEGYISKVKVMEEMGLEAGRNMVLAMKRLDKERIRNGEKASLELQKKIRQTRNVQKRRLEDLYEADEDPDNPAYCAGGY